MSKRLLTMGISSMLALGLAACSDFRRATGKEKSSPDEFEVVVRPPLSLPPGFSDRPEEILSEGENVSGLSAEARAQALLAVGTNANNAFDLLFDFSDVPADIRALVDSETYGIQLENRLPLQQLFGGLPEIGPVLDKMEEDARLRKVFLEGRMPTDGATLAIDPGSQSSVGVQ